MQIYAARCSKIQSNIIRCKGDARPTQNHEYYVMCVFSPLGCRFGAESVKKLNVFKMFEYLWQTFRLAEVLEQLYDLNAAWIQL